MNWLKYYTQKEFGVFLKENTWLADAERISGFYWGLDWEYVWKRNGGQQY